MEIATQACGVKILFDNNISPNVVKALSAVLPAQQCYIEHLRSKFAEDTPDQVWLSALGVEGGWAVLTRDNQMSRKPHEVRAWLDNGLVIFFLHSSWQNLDVPTQTGRLLIYWPRIAAAFHNATPPAGFRAKPDGTITPIVLSHARAI